MWTLPKKHSSTEKANSGGLEATAPSLAAVSEDHTPDTIPPIVPHSLGAAGAADTAPAAASNEDPHNCDPFGAGAGKDKVTVHALVCSMGERGRMFLAVGTEVRASSVSPFFFCSGWLSAAVSQFVLLHVCRVASGRTTECGPSRGADNAGPFHTVPEQKGKVKVFAATTAAYLPLEILAMQEDNKDTRNVTAVAFSSDSLRLAAARPVRGGEYLAGVGICYFELCFTARICSSLNQPINGQRRSAAPEMCAVPLCRPLLLTPDVSPANCCM